MPLEETTERTFTKETLDAADHQWAVGDFHHDWHRYRKLAADRGIIFPPTGDPTDQWNDRAPSQRASIYQAMDETPDLLEEVIGRSGSWYEVVGELVGWRQARIRELSPPTDVVCPGCGLHFQTTHGTS